MRRFFVLANLLLVATVLRATTSIAEMRVEGLHQPLGIDTSTPEFSWQLNASERGVYQTNYRIVVSDAAGTTLWDSGTVKSAKQVGIAYDGTALQSLAAYDWTLTVTDQNGETASRTARFETAFLSPKEWTAKWIGVENRHNMAQMEIVPEAEAACRYLRLNITKLGAPAATDPNYKFVQLDEVEIYVGGENVARKAKFTASSNWVVGNWNIKYINDGHIGDAACLGWTTTQNPSTPIRLSVDLGEEMVVERIVLYARQDAHALGDDTRAANFPASFTVSTSSDNKTFTAIYTAKDIPAPAFDSTRPRVPIYIYSFATPQKTVRRARIYATALGVFTMQLNGQPVTDAVLEPGESEYEKTILYSTYDVTKLLRSGDDNTLQAQVCGGLYNVETLNGRFSKGEVRNSGTPALLCEMLIEYDDGTSQRITSNEAWQTMESRTLGSNWWGGEDYDARDIDADPRPVVLVTPHFTSPHSGVSGHGTLRSRMYEPLRVVEEWPAVNVKSIRSGGKTLYIVDFGRNFAGQYRFRLKGSNGQTIILRQGESLNPNGTIFMENFYTGPADTYDVYTFRGDADGETWGPQFMYHGFRYLQITGLDEQPRPEDFTAMRIRSDVENIGSLVTSNSLINDIHTICRDAIASQLYNSITDCPHREKLGWLDVPNEMYVSLNSNFDMLNFYKKVVMDCFDAQQSDGHVPSVAPYYMDVYGDDVNWGGAAILVPYRNWRYYGDPSLMRRYYPQMKQLLSHFTANTTGYIINNSFSVLSDWGQETAGVSPMVPTEFTETCTYYYLLRCMAEMATELGMATDATAYEDRAKQVRSAFNKKFYRGKGVYASVSGNAGGRQSEQAMPLYYGLVDEADEALVAEKLAHRVRSDGYKIKTGEIALKCVFMSLAKFGYNDIVWKMANQTDCPSYGYWVKQGYTTTPEYWDVGEFSQNHCMMDHIEEWFFTQLGGIQIERPDSVVIAPYLPADLNRSDISTKCLHGTIRSAWERSTSGDVTFTITIPAGTSATLLLPVGSGRTLTENGAAISEQSAGIQSVGYAEGTATIRCGSGTYTFTVANNDQTSIDDVSPSASGIGAAPIAYDLVGRPAYQPLHGIHIVRFADGSTGKVSTK